MRNSGLLSALALAGCSTGITSSALVEGIDDAHHSSEIVRFASECEPRDDWEKPAQPFRIYGNTYYVGTCGIAALLVTGDEGHFLIDSGTEAGAEIVLANIERLGFAPEDVKLILSSHEHFDHVGGMARVQEATGGVVLSSDIAVAVMTSGKDHADDPQSGMHEPMRPITQGLPLSDENARSLLDVFGIHSISTPGHTPGAMSWQWRSCAPESGCKIIVYADSLSPISRDGYKFSDHPEYLAAYRAGIEKLRGLDCDILLTPHPSHSRMIERAATGTFEGGMTCAQYADAKTEALDARIAKETAQ